MNLLTRLRLAKRALLAPPAPFAARDSISTTLFSIDDEPHQPSSYLLELASSLIRRAAETDLTDMLSLPNMPAQLNAWPGEHYRLLAALVQILQPNYVVEIGTYTGASALALKRFLPEAGRIVTYDVVAWDSLPNTCLQAADFADGRLTQHVADLADSAVMNDHRTHLAEADLIFIDGPHDGPTEYRMLEQLSTVAFAKPPLMVFDDIKLPTMLKFWRDLPFPKLDVTSFGHWSGTGLAEWRSDT